MNLINVNQLVEHVEDGMTLALGGMTLHRRPVAFVRALLQRRSIPRDLTLLSFTAGIECDLLVGAECVTQVRTAYFGLQEFGLAPMFTQAAQSGQLRVIEETEASLVHGLRASIAGVPSMASTAWQGTDLLRLRPDVKTINDPYSDETLTAFPAIPVDVAVLHALAVDNDGNVLLNNNLGIDLELVYAADTVLVTVERQVDVLEKSADTVILPAPGADWVAIVPQGASPTACYPDYRMRGEVIMRYVEYCNAGRFDEFVATLA